MTQYVILALLSGLFINCFTASVMAKHNQSLQNQKYKRPYVYRTIIGINSIDKTSNELKIHVTEATYGMQDTNYNYLDPKTYCLKIRNIEPTYLSDSKLIYDSPCQIQQNSTNSQILFEEVSELNDAIWLPELGIFLNSNTGLTGLVTLYPPINQFEKMIFFSKSRTYKYVNSLNFLKNKKIKSGKLCRGKISPVHSYLLLRTANDELVQLSSNGGPFQTWIHESNGRMLSVVNEKIIDLSNCETLQIQTAPDLSKYTVIVLQYESPNGTFESPFQKTRIYKLMGNPSDLPKGISLIIDTDRSRKQDERIKIYSTIPILYPLSVSLDLVTSPIQLVSILIFGFQEHLSFWACLFAGRCAGPLG